MKRLWYAFFIGLLLIGAATTTSVLTVRADEKIAYGDEVSGEVTATAKEINYTLAGSRNDVIIIRVERDFAQKDNKLNPLVSISDSSTVIADTSKRGALSFIEIAVRLPAKDSYTISVSHSKDKETLGKYKIRVRKAEPIAAGETLDLMLSKVGNPLEYVTFNGDGKPMTISIERVSGNRSLSLNVYLVENGTLTTRVFIEGRGLIKSSTTFETDNKVIYIGLVRTSIYNTVFGSALQDTPFTIALGSE